MKSPQDSSFDLSMLARAQDGDMKALEAFLAHFDPLIRSVPSWGKWHFSQTVQEDLCQNVRVELQKSISSYQRASSLEYFVKRVCIHRCIDEIRRQVKRRQVFVPLIHLDSDGKEFQIEAAMKAGESFDPVALVVLSERGAHLRQILENVAETCRKAILMFYFDDLTYKQMADQLDISINTVGTRLNKCLSKLRISLKNDEYFGEGIPGSSDHSSRRMQHEQ